MHASQAPESGSGQSELTIQGIPFEPSGLPPADVPGTHFAVYEQQGTQAWQLVCAPVQDLRGAQSASVMFAAGMAYDPLGHQFVLALPSGPQMLVARVGH